MDKLGKPDAHALDRLNVAIVTSYFQRESGILRRTAQSIAHQSLSPIAKAVLVDWLIVDDGSPVSALSELPDDLPSWLHVRVIQQDNQGAAMARNRAFDALPEGTKYVALCDSDDEWSKDHLCRGILALESGFDFYFSDYQKLTITKTTFDLCRFHPQTFPRVDQLDDLYAFNGDFFDHVLRANPVGTSAILFRAARFRNLRFKRALARAGEDHVFWMEVGLLAPRICVSSRLEVKYGYGVNIYARSKQWGEPGTSARATADLIFYLYVASRFLLTDDQRSLVEQRIRGFKSEAMQNIIHGLRLLRFSELPVLIRFLRRQGIVKSAVKQSL
ncbi:hypothetical protein CKO42_02875 [Lamprobacter modestohalophilus]|uniref:Glycosyltransferase 2-like domain-containing protein n=1 Tax=Lamprobacter modestohalophilus TaxID=1064514 RepID=A0A9X1B2J7_9GAMM|nr:glycosyltransferase family 2 protein [Lamprobacter modestohalophilus]MBK1617415.1 hypothetical protein [Lamprobacter modestohalophilus]